LTQPTNDVGNDLRVIDVAAERVMNRRRSGVCLGV